ncbi:MAG: winged helix-turn-helix transcriptional regulator [Actinomycetota bacterium]
MAMRKGGTIAAGRGLSAAAETEDAPLARAVARVGDRWALLIVDALRHGGRRFNDLLSEIPGIASNVLSQRLKHLEAEGIIVARPYQTRPPRHAYELSGAGRGLAGALLMLAQWGSAESGEPENLRHGTCGTALETRWFCPTCERAVSDDEGEELRYV